MTTQKKAVSFALFFSLCFAPTFLMAKDHKHEKDKVIKQEKRHDSSSSSSSSSDDSNHHCHTCKPPTRICHVPYTIREDGKYCVNKDLFYNGDDVAITIEASNVTLNFNNHNLTLNNPNATGILIDSQSEVFIENDQISYTTRSSVAGTAGIMILNSEKVSVDNILIHNAFDGIFAQNSQDIRITRTRWTESFDSALFVSGCNSVFADDCTSKNTNEDFATAGITVRDDSQGIYFNNLSLDNTDIFFRTGRDAICTNLNIFINDPTYIFSALQFGSPTTTTPWEQALVKNCNFSVLPGENTATSASAVTLPRVVGAVLEDCVMECDTGGVEGNPSAVLAIGSNLPALLPTAQFSDSHNVRVVNCVIQNLGSTQFGVLIDAPSDTPNTSIVLDNCSVAKATLANIFVADTQSSVIKNSNITDGFNDGIFFGNFAMANSIIENTISNNCGRAVYLDFNSSNNIVKDNTVLNNGDGIEDEGTNNLLVGNTEFFNNLNCYSAGK